MDDLDFLMSSDMSQEREGGNLREAERGELAEQEGINCRKCERSVAGGCCQFLH